MMIEMFGYIVDVEEFLLRYSLIGLISLLMVLRIGLSDQDSRSEIRNNLGIVVLTVFFFWPYSLFCWVMSWPIWLMPVSELFRRRK